MVYCMLEQSHVWCILQCITDAVRVWQLRLAICAMVSKGLSAVVCQHQLSIMGASGIGPIGAVDLPLLYMVQSG
jgi:hypothetical protein